MNDQETDPNAEQPAWFRKWREKEERRRVKHEMRESGFNVFAVGLGVIAVGLGMATLKGIREIDIAEAFVLGISAMAMGLVMVFLSRWAAVREAADVQTRVSNHDRKDCWQKHAIGTIYYGAHYMPGSSEQARRDLESKLRALSTYPCGEK